MTNKIAYFSTSCKGSGHNFQAIKGKFTREEVLEINKLDGLIENIFNCTYEAKFFRYLDYIGLAINARPDDERYGSKTIVLVKDGKSIDEIFQAIEEYPFLKTQFERVIEKYIK